MRDMQGWGTYLLRIIRPLHCIDKSCHGGVAEWSIAPVLKTGKGQPFVSSNLTASARLKTAPSGAFFICALSLGACISMNKWFGHFHICLSVFVQRDPAATLLALPVGVWTFLSYTESCVA